MDSDTPKKKKKEKHKSIIDNDEVAVPDIRSNELKLNEKIGTGCFGVVYKGVCRGKTVAIKKLHQQDLEEKTLAEFKKEVAILTHLRHPNVILFMGACTEPGQLAIVTEYMDNGDMHTLLRTPTLKNKLTQLKLLEMARQVAQGMTWLHQSHPPIIHRDLKPSNLLVDENWVVKVCDFGLSAFQKTKTLQDKGTAPGTPLWMGPEVLQGLPLTEKVDVYSFAMVLWEMLTGKEPFEEYDSYDIFVDAVCLKHKRPPFSEDFPQCLQDLISACWDSDVSKRPSFQEILDKIDDAMVDISIVNDPAAAILWKKNWIGELSVPWHKFVIEFYSLLEIPFPQVPEDDVRYRCLKFVLCLPEKGNQETSNTVTLERFGHFLKWFGPSRSTSGNVLTRLVNLLTKPWFHGDIMRDKSVALLATFEKGTYLVRLSTTEPIEKTPFTISKVLNTGEINHQRIYANIKGDEIGYFTHIRHKTATKTEKAEGGVENLINLVSKELHLKKVCPGWPYAKLFSTKEEVEDPYGRDEEPLSDSDSEQV